MVEILSNNRKKNDTLKGREWKKFLSSKNRKLTANEDTRNLKCISIHHFAYLCKTTIVLYKYAPMSFYIISHNKV